jgi:hypothetical protein
MRNTRNVNQDREDAIVQQREFLRTRAAARAARRRADQLARQHAVAEPEPEPHAIVIPPPGHPDHERLMHAAIAQREQ